MRRSWFHKLRRKSWRGGDPDNGAAEPVAPAPSPCSPNRASYYVPTRDRALPWPRPVPARERDDNPKLRDTHFPQQASDIVFDVVVSGRRDDRFKAMPDLKLRPIVTRHRPNASPDTSSSAAVSPTACRVRPRFHVARPPPPPPSRRRKPLPTAAEEDEACGRRSRRRQSGLRWWMYESRVVVKDSADPEEDFLESMAEMIAANGVRSPRGLDDLLACYLELNDPDHHHAIVAAFRRAWVHLHSVPPPTKGRRCMLESRLT